MARQHNNLWIATLVTAAALSASCSGNSAMDNLAPAAPADNQGQAAVPQHFNADAPVLPRAGSDIFDIFPDLSPGIDWGAIFEAMHIPLVEGDNSIDVTKYLSGSSDVEATQVIVGFTEIIPGVHVPILGDAVHLHSSAGAMSYATFGFRDLPAGKDIIHVTAQGNGIYGSQAGAGLYIGLGDYANGTYRWFGPFAPDASDWDLPLHNLDTTSSSQHAYLTFAVYGGDEAYLHDIHVEVGDMPMFPSFDWGAYDFSVLLGSDGYMHFPHIPDPPPGL